PPMVGNEQGSDPVPSFSVTGPGSAGGRRVVMEVSVGPPTVTIHFDDEVAVCEQSAEMSSTKEQGYFAADTRLVSGYRLKVCGERPVLFNAAAVRDHSARFEFT